MKNNNLTLAFSAIFALSTLTYADDSSEIASLKQKVKDLQEVTQTLIDETSDLKTGFNYTTVDVDKSHSGLGAAASKVYFSKSPLSIGGYGEMYLANKDASGAYSAETQVKRLITYFGYKFNDNIILNTEVEYEGGGVTADGAGDEVLVEFMYIDFLQNKNFNLRVGNMLMPMGLTNQQHEPVLFTTVQRPQTAYYIIPSTWGESGIMAYGEIVEGVEYKLAEVTALQTQDSGKKWVRKGRGGSFKIKNPKAATLARIDYTGTNGLLVGASIYSDDALFMSDVHLDYKYNGARVYGTYAQTTRSGATGTQVKEASGGYLNASFDILSLTSIEKRLPLFIQYESVNPQKTFANGGGLDSVDTTTIGLNYFPHEQVVLKFDYAMANNDYANSGIDSNTVSLSFGFIF